MHDDAQEEGLLEGSAVEASTGTRFRFKGHYLVIRGTGHFAVWAEDLRGAQGSGLQGTLRVDASGVYEKVLAAVERMISTRPRPDS